VKTFPLLAALVLLAACGAGQPDAVTSPSNTVPLSGAQCPDRSSSWRQVRFADPDGTSLAGLELGTGTTGVVLAHEDRDNACEWLPFGKQLVDRGYRVLAFDFAGEGASEPHRSNSRLEDDVVSAVHFLKADKVVLMGASKGGTASLVAATMLTPPPAAVVSLSGPTVFMGIDAGAAVPKLTSPVLYLAAEGNTPFAENAQTLYDATPATDDRAIFIAIGGEHATALFYGAQGDQVTAAINKILAAHAPPTK
jgi:pimeloyl-ACP methyl ester carboxylesterase